MSGNENIDTDIFDTREEAIQAALDTAEPDEVIVICRGDWSTCPQGGKTCDFCARVPYALGLTASEALLRASRS